MSIREERERKREEDVQKAIAASSDEAEQIDSIAQIRGWFNGDGATFELVKQYMARSITLEKTVQSISEPINEAYRTADHGRQYRRSEVVARSQRQHHSAEDAERLWGLPQEFPELDDSALENVRSTEGHLWNLWYSVLHVAKRVPWRERAQHERLLDLVKAFKALPDPPQPTPMTVPLSRDWIWSEGTLWSSLLMLGPSARETWNDSPGCGAGFSLPEIHAWANVNAFIALVTDKSIADFWLYAIWAMLDALEDDAPRIGGNHHQVTVATKLDALLPVAAVWVQIAGKQMYEKAQLADADRRDISAVEAEEDSDKRDFTKKRWALWKRQLSIMALRDYLSVETKQLMFETVEVMERIEGG